MPRGGLHVRRLAATHGRQSLGDKILPVIQQHMVMADAAQLVDDSRSRYAGADDANLFATDKYQLFSLGGVTWRHPPCCGESVVLPFTRKIAAAILAIPRTIINRFMKPTCDLRWPDDY